MAENFYGLTDTGKVRTNNEDTFVAQTTGKRFILACVIDGVGGYNGGEVAAAIAREQIIRHMNGVEEEVIPAMIEALKLASKSIYMRRQAEKELESMACVATMAIVDTESNQFYYAHVGDTRLYLLRDGSLVKISKDHSFVGFLEDSGRLTESAAMGHPKRNEINKALGFDQLIDTDNEYIETGQSPFLPGDMLLLCSDGLTDMADKQTITNIITQNTSLPQKAAKLIEAANNNGGNDNVTVVLVENDKVPQRPQATMPVTDSKKKETLAKGTDVKNSPPEEVPNNSPVAVTEKKGNGITIILSVLCLLLLASTIWLYLQWSGKNLNAYPEPPQVTKKRNQQELKLQKAFNEAKGDTLILADTAYSQPIIISDTLHINKDTLYVKGNVSLRSDSSYKGPAIVMASNKLVVFEGLKFEDFKTAIYAGNAGIQLKAVQFLNCDQAILKVYGVNNNKLINSNLSPVKFQEDTVTKPTLKADGNR
jgi:serine/threonine protein phosphatase PrpC